MIFVSHRITRLRTLGACLSASILVLGACAPLPEQGATALPPTPKTAPSPAPAAPSPRVAGVQHIAVGGATGYHTEVTVTPPPQVCDFDAFADGFQYGYASNWNRLAMEAPRDAANGGPPPVPTFDPASIRLQEERYRIEWNGSERVNACASDGYLIGRIVGTHQAGVDQKAGAGR